MERDRPWRLLFTWTRWLRLSHPNLRRINLWASPAIGLAVFGVLMLLPDGVNFSGDRGIAHQVNGLLQILAPFFVAALAAISSFQRETLDEKMGGQQPTIVVDGNVIEPTKREFFGYLFGYLAALSIILYAVGAVFCVIGSSQGAMATAVNGLRHSWGLPIVKLVYLGALTNLGLTTFVGLHFLLVYLPAGTTHRVTPPKKPAVPPSNAFIPDRRDLPPAAPPEQPALG